MALAIVWGILLIVGTYACLLLRMKNRPYATLRIMWAALTLLLVTSTWAGTADKWLNFEPRVKAVIPTLPTDPIKTQTIEEWGAKLDDSLKNSDPNSKAIVGDCLNWLGYAYSIAAGLKNPGASKEEKLRASVSLLFEHLNNHSIKDLADHALELKAKYPDLWKRHVETY